MRLLTLLLLVSSGCLALEGEPDSWTGALTNATATLHLPECSTIAGNFAYDLRGDLDFRENTWGYAGADYRTLTFKTPVKIYEISGDLIAWTRGAAPDAYGVLAAIHTTGPGGSKYADLAADNHLLYVQGVITDSTPASVQFRETFPEGFLIPDGKLIFKFAKYLDLSGLPTHAEITFSSIKFCVIR